MRLLANPVFFVLAYIIFMLPTYILPYIGSNSTVVNLALSIELNHLNPAFYLHLSCLLILIALTWCRGSAIYRKGLIIFPVLALVFDLLPGLNFIPLIPTLMHLLAIILGTIGLSIPPVNTEALPH